MSDYELQSRKHHHDTFIWKIDKEYLDEELPDLQFDFDRNQVLYELFEPIRCNSNYRINSLEMLVREAFHQEYVDLYYKLRSQSPLTPRANDEDIRKANREAVATLMNKHFPVFYKKNHFSFSQDIFIDDVFLDDQGNLQRIYKVWKMIPDRVLGRNILGVMKKNYQVVFHAIEVPEDWQAVPYTIAYHSKDDTIANVTTVEVAPREDPLNVAHYLQWGSYPPYDRDRNGGLVVDEFESIYEEENEDE